MVTSTRYKLAKTIEAATNQLSIGQSTLVSECVIIGHAVRTGTGSGFRVGTHRITWRFSSECNIGEKNQIPWYQKRVDQADAGE